MKRITIVGTGYVGLVDGVVLANKGNKVLCLDKNEEKIRMMRLGISPIFEKGLSSLLNKGIRKGNLSFSTNPSEAFCDSEIIFIGVGTPELENGEADTSEIEKVAQQIACYATKDCLVVLKSTSPIGTCLKIEGIIGKNAKKSVRIRVASNPEFLSQGTAVEDALFPSRIVIGTDDPISEKTLRDLYSSFDSPIVSVSRSSSEMIKYASNAFLAVKISYINEIANLCEKIDADVKEVAKGMSFDPRIGGTFLNAGVGFGGGCLPKDAKAYSYFGKIHGCPLKTVDAAIEINDYQQFKLIEKALLYSGPIKGKRIAILGLSFKPETDDIRGSVAIRNIDILIDLGAIISVYDPEAMKKTKEVFPLKPILYAQTPEEALWQAQMVFIFTEWEEFKKIKPSTFLHLMHTPLIFDGRNIFNPQTMKKNNIEYFSIGRKAHNRKN